ncbi:ParM/StbA family protein [Paenibacillus polymyxa]|uniref:ParM/StbA family protein n=1 Tax=Paenibacillus polymyxa TaxID=1406 RepID=UPI0032AF213B
MKKYNIDNDFGNSTNKMYINGQRVDQPSVVKRIFGSVPVTEGSTEQNIFNLFNQLNVHITSPALKRDGHFIVGERALQNPDKSENMNIKIGNKAEHDIPVIMSLSSTAAYAVKDYFEAKGKLPKTLDIEGVLAGCIPASEWSPNKARYLEERFTGTNGEPTSHIVIVYVGYEKVTVTITYSKAKITQEGVPGLYALIEAKEDILANFRELYKGNPKVIGMTQRDLASKKGLGIDIGSGTTEYIHTHGVNPMLDTCDGKKRGVGHASEEAAKLLNSELGNRLNINRQRFDNILLDVDSNYHDLAVNFMDEAQYSEAKNIMEDVEERYSVISGDIDFIWVFGGGSITFKKDLYPQLVKFAQEVHCLVLWIPEKYAIDLNIKGLKILHEKVFFKAEVDKA